jgi:hypothetical protein
MVIAAFVVKDGVVPVRVIVRVGVAFLPDSILLMRERHALSARDRGQALERNGQGQEQHSNKPEERFRHHGHCNAVVLRAGRGPGSVWRMFRRPAQPL